MNQHIAKLMEIASRVSSSNPILGYELEKATLQYAAENPDPKPKSFDSDFESAAPVLKKLQDTLKKALEKIKSGDLDPASAEFVKFFDDEAAEEKEKLREIIKKMKSAKSAKSASARVAGEGEDKDVPHLKELEQFLVELDDLEEEPSEGGIKSVLKGAEGLSKQTEPKVETKKTPSDETQSLMQEVYDVLDPKTEVQVMMREIYDILKHHKTSSISSALPVLIRLAHSSPRLRTALLPVIKRMRMASAK
jgi:ferritin